MFNTRGESKGKLEGGETREKGRMWMVRKGRLEMNSNSPFTFTFPHFILPATTFPEIAHRTQFRQ